MFRNFVTVLHQAVPGFSFSNRLIVGITPSLKRYVKVLIQSVRYRVVDGEVSHAIHVVDVHDFGFVVQSVQVIAHHLRAFDELADVYRSDSLLDWRRRRLRFLLLERGLNPFLKASGFFAATCKVQLT